MEGIMSVRHLTYTSIMAALLSCTGCMTDLAPSASVAPAELPARFVSQDQARELAFTYRRQAAEITELARRIELEASVSIGRLGHSPQESSRRSTEMKRLLAAAEEADQLARTYARQVPHGQVQ
jgi:hypothetical protein